MKAEYIENAGDDLSVVNAARVSFDKVSLEFSDDDARLIRYLAKHNHWTPFAHKRYTFKSDYPILDCSPEDPLLIAGMVHMYGFRKVRHSLYGWIKLIQSDLININCVEDIKSHLIDVAGVSADAFGVHVSGPKIGYCYVREECDEYDPLFIDVTLRMSSPVPMRTQCFKHKAGFVENEESRRYVSSRPDVYIPDAFRSEPIGSIKQGSGGVHPDSDDWLAKYTTMAAACVDMYANMIDDGVCPEQARFILPQGCEVSWIWTGNVTSYARFYNQRTYDKAQKEIQDLAHSVGDIIGGLYPDIWATLTNGEK